MRQGTTVLVVDDEPSIRLLCKVNLELEGFHVLEAGTLSEARGHLDAERVDVVLLDVHVGGEDGREFLRELRGRGRGPAVAYLSGSMQIERGSDGVDAVIPKPFQLEELSETVKRLAELAPVG
jgi:DNA-binding response OmpR family regulator